MNDNNEGEQELGRAIRWGWIIFGDLMGIGYECTVDPKEVEFCLIEDARRTLKPGDRFEIRRMVPTNHGRSHGMAWYHTPGMCQASSWIDPKEPRHESELGVIIVRRLVVS